MDAVFDRATVRAHRNRAAARFADHDFLIRAAGERLAERVADQERPFPRALDVGCHDGLMAELLAGHVGELVQTDHSPAMAKLAQARGGNVAVMDEELVPFAEHSFDLVVSALSLHWVNDLPGSLSQLRRCIRPGGMIVASLFGVDTLRELRDAFLVAEAELTNGASPRVSPFVDVRDAGDLLERAGFVRQVADTEAITVTYADPLKLLADLRGMGETNALRNRENAHLSRAVLARAMNEYTERFANPDGRVRATFEIVTLTAWAP